MQQLVGRLAALDPVASETLKVITYFDALVDGHASINVMLRGAAVLSGCAAGYADGGAAQRVSPSGDVASGGNDEWPRRPVSSGGSVWIERVGAVHANDEMILERLAFGIAVAVDRSPKGMMRRAVEALIDSDSSLEDRRAAAQRLSLSAQGLYRVVVAPASAELMDAGLVVETPAGPVRVGVRPGTTEGRDSASRMGVGFARKPEVLYESWASALTALRFTGNRQPILFADELGTLLLLAPGLTMNPEDNPDLASLKGLLATHPRCLDLLESIVESDSLRAVAIDLGLHHSTVQTRVADYSQALGFDLKTRLGHHRLSLVLSHHRFNSNTFT